jgi:hypothetical protein
VEVEISARVEGHVAVFAAYLLAQRARVNRQVLGHGSPVLPGRGGQAGSLPFRAAVGPAQLCYPADCRCSGAAAQLEHAAAHIHLYGPRIRQVQVKLGQLLLDGRAGKDGPTGTFQEDGGELGW